MFLAYREVAKNFCANKYDPLMLARLLGDVEFREIGIAFATAIEECVVRNEPMRRLSEELGLVIQLAALTAFGTTQRDLVATWFLEDITAFTGNVLQATLNLARDQLETTAAFSVRENAVSRLQTQLKIVFDVCDGCREYGIVETSSLAHFVLVACSSLRSMAVEKYSDSKVVFLEMIAKMILEEPHRDVGTFDTAFGYFAGSVEFRSLLDYAIQQSWKFGAENVTNCKLLHSELNIQQSKYCSEINTRLRHKRKRVRYERVPSDPDAESAQEALGDLYCDCSPTGSDGEIDVEQLFAQAEALRATVTLREERQKTLEPSTLSALSTPSTPSTTASGASTASGKKRWRTRSPSPLPPPPTNEDETDAIFARLMCRLPKAVCP